MERRVAVGLVTAIVGFASQGCGEIDERQQEGDHVETVQSALGSFGAWNFMGSFNNPNTSALARGTGSTPLVAFGRFVSTDNGVDGFMFVLKQDSSGHWGGQTQFLDGGAKFIGDPSAVLFDVPQGPLVGHYAIVAKKADNKFYFMINDRFGSGILQNWQPLPGGTFSQSFSAPAITFIPQSASVGPQRTLVVTGLGNDGVVYWATNQLASDFTYNAKAWTGFFPLPGGNPANQTFVGPPAITFACQTPLFFNSPKSSMALAIMASDPNGTRTFFSRRFNGTSWSGWSQVQGGTFHDGPALAGRPGCSIVSPEISLFGRGEDDQIWVTTQLSGGAASFTQLPISAGGQGIFGGLPRAVGTASAANVSAVKSDGISNYSNAAPAFPL